MRCTRCNNFIYGQVFDMTPLPNLAFDWSGGEMPDPVAVDIVLSCRECLTSDELAKECAPIALFVVEQMMRATHQAGRVGSDNPLVQALHHVRAKLLYDCAMQSRAELQRRSRGALAVGRPMTPADARLRWSYEAIALYKEYVERLAEPVHTVIPKEHLSFFDFTDAADYRHNPAPAPPKCVHCQRPSAELSYSLCPECIPCHDWFDGTGYVFEDAPFKKCTHLNRAQRRFICDVGTRAAYADGGKRLAELADAPEPNGGTDSKPQRPSWWPEEPGPDVRGVPGTRFGSVGEAMAADYKRTAEELREQAAADTWVCTNHPPGFEITYPATTPTCEVCEEPKP